MIKSKIKGCVAERELFHMFWDIGWVTVRVAGSGSTKYPAPDLISSNGFRRFIIEAKYINDTKKYFKKKEIEDLVFFAQKFGGEPWIAVKFQGINWFFLSTNDLEETPKGYSINVSLVKRRGFGFEEFTKLV